VTLAVNNANIAEAAGVATFTATLSAASGQDVTVDLGFTGTATLTGDYVRSGTQIVITAGSTTGTIMVTAVQDTIDELNETVIVDITGVTNGTENGTQQQTTTITDDDDPPTVTLSRNNANIAEAAGVATFTATLSAASGQDVTVDLGFTGTATLTSDYTRSGTQIVITAGSTTGTITVTAVQDTIDELNETVIVDITGVANGTENGTQQQTTTITDDDNPPTVTLAVNNAAIAEAAGVATFTATLSAVSGQDVTVDLGFTGTATLTSDYTRSATQIVIAAGSLTGTATVTAVQDTRDEPNETVIVDIAGVTNGTESGTQQATTTITDDDDPPTVTLAVNNAAIAEAAGVATFTATLSAASGLDVTVDLGFTGTATLTDDYTRSGVQIVITAGNTTGTATVTAVQDALDEANETVIVDITSVTNGTESGTQQATTTITDDDAAPSVTLAVNNAAIAEAAGIATFTATLSAVSGQDVTVDLGFTGTATLTSDYTRSATQIVIAAGSLTGTATVTAVQDTRDEPNETVIVDITGVTNGTESGTQQKTTTITDDDDPPTVTLAVNNAAIAEAAGVATFTATLSAVSGQAVTVDLGFTGIATNATDYTRSGTQIVIAAGSLTGTVTVTAVQDALDETNETVIVDITGVTNGTESGTQQKTTTITDDDDPPTVTLAVNNATIAEAAGVATFTATLSAVSGQDVTVDLGFTGTATNANDYSRSGTQIVIAAGSLTGTVTVTAVQDALDETNETVIVDITGVTNGTESGTQQKTTTITDDDNPPTVTLAVNNATIAEAAGVATFTATLSAVSGQDVTVDLGFTGTATNANDYTRSATQIVIVIAAGSTTGSVTVTAVQDALDETNETVIVDVTGVTNGTESGTQQKTTTITDDDDPPTVTLAVNNANIAEAAGVATFTATLSAVSGQAVTVNLGFTGTATLTNDYTRSDTQIVIAAGSTTGSVTVTAVQDALNETNETVIVDITSVTNGTESGTQQATTTITDDDGLLDFGDAPDTTGPESMTPDTSTGNYQTLLIDNGPRHIIVDGLMLGTRIDGENDGQQNAIAQGDDDVPPDADDEDGLVQPGTDLLFAAGVVPLVNVRVTNTTGSEATLYGWIDYNGNGVFEDIERGSVAVDSGRVNVIVPPELPTVPPIYAGQTYARFRLSTDNAAASPIGLASDGEVEDYFVPNIDYGDAPDSYKTLLASNGAAHVLGSGLLMGGDAVDAELDAAPSAAALGVDALSDDDGTTPRRVDDEDGLIPVNLTVGQFPKFTIEVQNPTQQDAKLYGWLDLNRNGVFESTERGPVVDVPVNPAIVPMMLTFPNVLTENEIGTTFARFRLSTDDAAAQPFGLASDGEVEDYRLVIDNPIPTATIGGGPGAGGGSGSGSAGDPVTVGENGGTGTITATLTNTRLNDTTVNLAFSGTASFGVDYSAPTAMIIAAGQLSTTILLTPINNDTIAANGKTVVVDVDGVVNGTEQVEQRVFYTIVEDDVAGFTVTETGEGTSVSESRTTDTFTAVLNAQPDSDVVLTVTSGDTGEVTAEPSTLTFTSENWNVAQTVTLTGENDPQADGNQTTNVTVSVNDSTSDNAFDSVADQTVAVTTIDNEVPGFTVAETAGSTSVSENGSTDTFTVVLTAQPLSDVVISVTSDDTGEVTVNTTALTFTPQNWDQTQTVTLTGEDDSQADGNQTTNVTVSVSDSASDNIFDPVADQIVTVTTIDNEVAGFTVVQTDGSTTAVEGGNSDTFTVVLTGQPLTDVVIDVTSGNTAEATTDKTTLTFTSANWNVPQIVTATAVNDPTVDGTRNTDITLGVNASMSADAFDGVANQTVTVTTTDNDVAGFTVVQTDGSTSVSEDGTTDTFTVVLDAQPLDNVVVGVTSGDEGEVTVDKPEIVFTPGNWDQPQIVTVSGVDDSDPDGVQNIEVTLGVVDDSSHPSFQNVPNQTLNVTNSDNDVSATVTARRAVVTTTQFADRFDAVDGLQAIDVKFTNNDTDTNGTAGEFAEISAAANLAGMAAFVFVMRAGEKSNRGLAGLHGSLSFSLAGPFLEGCVC